MVGRTAELDRRIGERVRTARLMKGVSQGYLGAELGITFQQVQKYEKGTNRVSASTLLRIAEVLGMDLLYFFSGDLPAVAASGGLDLSDATAVDFDILRGVLKIKSAKTKRSIADLVATFEGQPSPKG
jgi:transcriptional regulator with XRE-family HTH domain